MAEFQSKLCNICRDTLDKVFSSIDRLGTGDSDRVPHHLTKNSLVDSVVAQSCHLCLLIVDDLKARWSGPWLGLEEEERSAPSAAATALSEEDFVALDFEYATYPSDRLRVRRAIGRLPEDIGMTARISKYETRKGGSLGRLVFDSASFGGGIKHTPLFLIYPAEGNFSCATVLERMVSSNIVLSSI
jgi:hypothetical protein